MRVDRVHGWSATLQLHVLALENVNAALELRVFASQVDDLLARLVQVLVRLPQLALQLFYQPLLRVYDLVVLLLLLWRYSAAEDLLMVLVFSFLSC